MGAIDVHFLDKLEHILECEHGCMKIFGQIVQFHQIVFRKIGYTTGNRPTASVDKLGCTLAAFAHSL